MNSAEVLKSNNVPGFESIKLINSKRQPPNPKKLLTKVEFSNEEIRVRKCQDFPYQSCKSLLLSKIQTTYKTTSASNIKS